MEWFTAAMLSMLAFSVVFLLFKKIADLKVRAELVFLYYFLFSAIILFVYIMITKGGFDASRTQLILIVAAASVGVFGNILLYSAIGTSSNPGYALAIVGLNTIVVAIASIFIFKADFTLIKIAGVVLAVLGVTLVSWK